MTTTKKVTHTPGPWVWRQIGNTGRFRLEQARPEFEMPPILVAEQVRECDANLIKAAPDLFDALTGARAMLMLMGVDMGAHDETRRIEAAIAKATL